VAEPEILDCGGNIQIPKISASYIYYAIVPNIIYGSYIYYVMSLFPLIIKNSAIIRVQLEKVIKIALKIEMII
jgi:hypothetical protein